MLVFRLDLIYAGFRLLNGGKKNTLPFVRLRAEAWRIARRLVQSPSMSFIITW